MNQPKPYHHPLVTRHHSMQTHSSHKLFRHAGETNPTFLPQKKTRTRISRMLCFSSRCGNLRLPVAELQNLLFIAADNTETP